MWGVFPIDTAAINLALVRYYNFIAYTLNGRAIQSADIVC